MSFAKIAALLLVLAIFCPSKVTGSSSLHKKHKKCVCTAEYDPVCGTNGESYSNVCQLKCAGATEAYPGSCVQGGGGDYGGGSGSGDYGDYDSGSGSGHHGGWDSGSGSGHHGGWDSGSGSGHHGGWDSGSGSGHHGGWGSGSGGGDIDEHSSCICPTLYDPVCGFDGVTYGNSCELKCAGATKAHQGWCSHSGGGGSNEGDSGSGGGDIDEHNSCICPALYDPVCGIDDVTYGNSCELGCAGVREAYSGRCYSSTHHSSCRLRRRYSY